MNFSGYPLEPLIERYWSMAFISTHSITFDDVTYRANQKNQPIKAVKSYHWNE